MGAADHRDLAADEREARHWDVDYLLGHPVARLEHATRSPGVAAECAVAARVEGESVPGFGASDCGCTTHLVYDSRRDDLVAAVEAAHRSVRDAD